MEGLYLLRHPLSRDSSIAHILCQSHRCIGWVELGGDKDFHHHGGIDPRVAVRVRESIHQEGGQGSAELVTDVFILMCLLVHECDAHQRARRAEVCESS